jgi:hypothetical protein
MVAQGLYSMVATDLVQRCRESNDKSDCYFKSLKLMCELKHRVNDAQNLPFRQLDEFVKMMDCDASESLEASLCVIYYHILLAQEVDIQIQTPQRLLSAAQINAVQACRSLD